MSDTRTPKAQLDVTIYSQGGTDVALADGGTGASTAATARANLGVPNITVGTTAPGSPATGDLWVDTN